MLTEITDRPAQRTATRFWSPPRRREDRGGIRTPPVLWMVLALLCGPYIPPWAWMWVLAIALFAACKWLTWWPHRWAAPPMRSVGYLLAYPGMDARAFLLQRPHSRPTVHDAIRPAINVVVGALLVWLVARHAHPRIAPAVGMIGVILTLHFGVLHLAALAWQHAGVAAMPLMRQPLRARSLADFWGRRWNTGFRALAHDLVFTPLVGRIGPLPAAGMTFLISGVVHDLVISLPARGGFGLPTLYFLIEFAGIVIERSLRLHSRSYAIAFTLFPMPLLFHTPFLRVVMIPFLHAIGGLP